MGRSLVLPAELSEVMWRVARASMDERDWPAAVMALEGLAVEGSGDGQRGRNGAR